MQIADLHIHSKYSRATSRDCDAPHLDKWARNKGIHIVGTGDFTHPGWRKELSEALLPAQEGFYTLRKEYCLPAEVRADVPTPRFVLSGEISTIYKKNGKTRKVHHVILLPSLEAAETLAHRLEAIGNLHSDGRPILGLDSRDLLEITLDACPEALYIPAHIWTPHFSLFGAFSGFDTLEECYEDMTPYVHALETGLSSDPSMIRRISALDQYTLVSHSDAHSPAKLGREANLLDIPLSYTHMKRAIETGEGFEGTLEFFPEEGKYHLDGHRNCHVCLDPSETLRLGGKCPVCGKKITIGVVHRQEELADRTEPFYGESSKPFESLIPLPELIASCLGFSTVSKKTIQQYETLLGELGSEFSILRQAEISEIQRVAGFAIAEGVRRMRTGQVHRKSGFDGEYGVISLFEPQELETLKGQLSLLPPEKRQPKKQTKTPMPPSAAPQVLTDSPLAPSSASGLNPEQQEAVTTEEKRVAVIAGPGTGKTKTLVARIAYLIEEKGVNPKSITAVTFTRQAAAEMHGRLEASLGKQALRGLTIGTFHHICLNLLPPKPLLGEGQALEILQSLLPRHGSNAKPLAGLRQISLVKNGQTCAQAGLDANLYAAYEEKLQGMNARDLDDLLLEALAEPSQNKTMFTHLLVDEFQDSNEVQRRLIRHWHEQGETLFIIGDPDQSIYGFRGANADCFEALGQAFPDLRLISLESNYRSAPAILKSALTLIAHNPGQPRLLTPTRQVGEPVRLMNAQKPFDENVWIAREIARMVGGVDMLSAASTGKERHANYGFSDIGILCRTRRQLEQVETCLLHDDIPCIIHGRESYLADKKVVSALGFFGALLHPKDPAPLAHCLSVNWRIPEALIQRALEALPDCAPHGKTDPTALRTALSPFAPFEPFLDAVDSFLPKIQKEKPRLLLQDWVQLHGKNSAMERLLQSSVFHSTMEDFWQTLSYGQDADIRRASGKTYTTDAVRLMTLHGSKGLEFPVVFLSCDHMAPQGHAVTSRELEEERRLLFVGMTRAREELILTSAEPVSAFLAEITDTVQPSSIRPRNPRIRTEQLRLC